MNNTFFIFLIFIPILIIILLLLNLFLAEHKPYAEKLETYECGFYAVGEQTRSAFNVKFFLVAILFMVFDVDIIFIIPLGSFLGTVSIFGIIMFILFSLIITLGLIFEIGKGSLDFTKIESISASNPSSPAGTDILTLTKQDSEVNSLINVLGTRHVSTNNHNPPRKSVFSIIIKAIMEGLHMDTLPEGIYKFHIR